LLDIVVLIATLRQTTPHTSNITMSSKVLSLVTRLSGQANYDIWCIRMKAALTEKEVAATIKTDGVFTTAQDEKALSMIFLALDDGPLLQFRQCTTAVTAWSSLKNLYSPKSFSSEFLICKELFETNLEGCNNSMEDFLNTIKRVMDELKAKKVQLPDQVVLAWDLNNLTAEYDGFTAIITQSLRTDSSSIKLENLFASLIDESRRQKSKDSGSTALFTNGSKKRKFQNPKQNNKRPKYTCTHCQKTGHSHERCWELHPELKDKFKPSMSLQPQLKSRISCWTRHVPNMLSVTARTSPTSLRSQPLSTGVVPARLPLLVLAM
jgi:hypothetical protein